MNIILIDIEEKLPFFHVLFTQTFSMMSNQSNIHVRSSTAFISWVSYANVSDTLKVSSMQQQNTQVADICYHCLSRNLG